MRAFTHAGRRPEPASYRMLGGADDGRRMVMKRLLPGGIAPHEITPRDVYLSRRSLLATALAGSAAAFAPPALPAEAPAPDPSIKYSRNARYSVNEAPNSYADITSYNNFYEF